jgi:hypothetical protein
MEDSMKSFKHSATVIMLALLFLLGGCDSPHVPAPDRAPEFGDMDVQFNPQPEPPGQVYSFEATGAIERPWVGTFLNPRTGEEQRLEVNPISVGTIGETVHLVQTWIFHPPDPVHPPDPIFPPDPIVVGFTGILNLANGMLILNGIIEDGMGGGAHIRGRSEVGEGGVLSTIGELMFNPQPEPPGLH